MRSLICRVVLLLSSAAALQRPLVRRAPASSRCQPCAPAPLRAGDGAAADAEGVDRVADDAEGLTPRSKLADFVLKGGTEMAFSSELNKISPDLDPPGKFYCAGCGCLLFQTDTKYDSGTGWPSFWAAEKDAVDIDSGNLLSLVFGCEVKCRECKGHLGHRFEDGPRRTTGKRFCINGAALRYREEPL
mmetsp:Transcript_24529/g.73627  ORF Transcript_24529/g.73627 Transcript_24529/m.73627 type:complete len:188 (-) Transcript_24529:73-636(-)